MNKLNTYNIDIFKLRNTTHVYDFEVKSSFFKVFEDREITEGKATVIAQIKKSELMLEMNMRIKSKIKLTCDRSLDTYDYQLETNNNIIFKYGDNWEELSDEIVIIPRDEQRINVAQYIYEFIRLAVPMKKLHPRFVRNEQGDGSLHELVYCSSEKEKKNRVNEGTDPRWEKLKAIKNKI